MVVGVVLGIAILALLAFCLYRRHRKSPVTPVADDDKFEIDTNAQHTPTPYAYTYSGYTCVTVAQVITDAAAKPNLNHPICPTTNPTRRSPPNPKRPWTAARRTRPPSRSWLSQEKSKPNRQGTHRGTGRPLRQTTLSPRSSQSATTHSAHRPVPPPCRQR
jgi:hypothetical protein